MDMNERTYHHHYHHRSSRRPMRVFSLSPAGVEGGGEGMGMGGGGREGGHGE
jgi:hypothetical protein